jgi:photosystem II stability/assembly factor-like uncharacterized protein
MMHSHLSSLPTVRRTATRARRRSPVALALLAAAALALTGCAATAAAPTPQATTSSSITHVHGIVPDPTSDGFLIGTHEGIYTASADGESVAPVDGPGFDAMGLTAVGDVLLASGHPGPDTPPDLGAPHLGIIRSTDGAQTWTPLAFTGSKDFHVLTAAPDGTVFGLPTDSPKLLHSRDAGESWASTGASVEAFNLTVDAGNRLIASTMDGLLTSTDQGATFGVWPGTPPLIALLNSSPDRERIVGVAADLTVWVTAAGSDEWTQVGAAGDGPEAIAITNAGDILLADASGIVALPKDAQSAPPE